LGEFHTREEKEAQVKASFKMGERASWIINLEGDFPIKINESLSLKGN